MQAKTGLALVLLALALMVLILRFAIPAGVLNREHDESPLKRGITSTPTMQARAPASSLDATRFGNLDNGLYQAAVTEPVKDSDPPRNVWTVNPRAALDNVERAEPVLAHGTNSSPRGLQASGALNPSMSTMGGFTGSALGFSDASRPVAPPSPRSGLNLTNPLSQLPPAHVDKPTFLEADDLNVLLSLDDGAHAAIPSETTKAIPQISNVVVSADSAVSEPPIYCLLAGASVVMWFAMRAKHRGNT